ncbi:MAG: hypothetical protein JXR70_14625 [Spirochaetales bacterium]|nr:hypothetical protein [Spirochaetales bacterium]
MVLEKSIFDEKNLESYDFMFSNHFMHHLSANALSGFLKIVHNKSRINFLMNDLAREPFSYFAYRIFAALFLHNSFAAYDGAISILRGFTTSDLSKAIGNAGLEESMLIKKAMIGRIFLTRKVKTQSAETR